MMLLLSPPRIRVLPRKALAEAIWKNGKDAAKAGPMIENGGLNPSAISVCSASRRKSNRCGWSETKEVVGDFAIFEFKSMKETAEFASDFMDFIENTGPAGKVKQRIAAV